MTESRTESTTHLPTVVELFERQVARVPDAPAVAAAGITLSYAELDARANRVARLLAARGVGPEQAVAVAMPPSAGVIVALVGVLKAGAAYLPVDVAYPPGRVAFMLADARPTALITDEASALRLGLDAGNPDAGDLNAGGPAPGDPGIAGAVLLGSGGESAETARFPAFPLRDGERTAPLAAARMAYVMYTSGSTGTPKAVIIEHRALADYLDWSGSHYPSLAGTSLWHSSVSFDQTITSLWSTLAVGGQVLVGKLTGGGHAAGPGLHVPEVHGQPPDPAGQPAGAVLPHRRADARRRSAVRRGAGRVAAPPPVGQGLQRLRADRGHGQLRGDGDRAGRAHPRRPGAARPADDRHPLAGAGRRAAPGARRRDRRAVCRLPGPGPRLPGPAGVVRDPVRRRPVRRRRRPDVPDRRPGLAAA